MILAQRKNFDSLSVERKNLLLSYYNEKKSRFIASLLNEDQLRIIDETALLILPEEKRKKLNENIFGFGLEDYFLLAEIEFRLKTTPQDVEVYDRCHVKDLADYIRLQIPWIEEERRILTNRLGREPRNKELFHDFEKNKNGKRFKMYYCKKFPDRVESSNYTERPN